MQRWCFGFLVFFFFLIVSNCRKTQESLASDQKALKPVKKVKIIQKSLAESIALINKQIREAQTHYRSSYKSGKIESWASFHKAKALLTQVEASFRQTKEMLSKKNPGAEKSLHQAILSLKTTLKKKGHPQEFGQLAHSFLRAAQSVSPETRHELATPYIETVKKMNQMVQAEQVSGNYRVGLSMQRPKPYFYWIANGQSLRRMKVNPTKNKPWMVEVQLRHTTTGAPLSGTHVSIETLDAKSKKQLSTQKLQFVWKGFPAYVGYLAKPKTDNVIVQITVSPFPVARTMRSKNTLLQRASLHFPVALKDHNWVFSKEQAPTNSKTIGDEVLLASATVGGQFKKGGSYRAGFSIIPNEPILEWKMGHPAQVKKKGSSNGQIVVFVQDIHSGLLIPDARVSVLLYYDVKGKTYRDRIELHSVYDGFPSYRAELALKKDRTYHAKVMVRPAPHGRFESNLPLSYTFAFDDVRSSF